MKRIILAIAFIFCLLNNAWPQGSGISIFSGVSNYGGDISVKKGPGENAGTGNGVIGISYCKEISGHFMIRAEVNYTVLSGNDRYNKDSAIIKRNLRFETSILEANIAGEMYLLNRYENKFSPYLIVGAGLFHFNPYSFIENRKIFLKPLSTEGQGLAKYPDRKPYSLLQPFLSYGGGLKYSINNKIEISCELSLRKTFTDYIDDISTTYIDKSDLLAAKGQLAVGMAYRGDEIRGGNFNYPVAGSTRGNENKKDSYYFAGLKVMYVLSAGNHIPHTKRNKKQNKCPGNVL